MLGIGGLGLFRDIVAGQAELGEDEGRALVELDNALEGPGDIIGGNRIAREANFRPGFSLNV